MFPLLAQGQAGAGATSGELVHQPALPHQQAPADQQGPWYRQEPLYQQELLRQQERERVMREQQESAAPDVRLPPPPVLAPGQIPKEEDPCFAIRRIELAGEDADRFRWALDAADPSSDPGTGRCLGTEGINVVMARVQNAIVARGFVTTRVLAVSQDLNEGILTLTVVPGRVRDIRYTANTPARASPGNAVPIRRGDLLNLRDIEQALENLKRVPTVEADIQIVPTDGEGARPGESDLVITWKQRRPFRLNLALDDAGSRATGKYQASATLSMDDMLMLSDLFYANFNHDLFNTGGKGTHGYTVHYSVPFGYWQLGATAGGYNYRQTVAGKNQAVVYAGASENAEIRLSHLLYRDATRKTSAYVRGWLRQFKNRTNDMEIDVQRHRTGGWEWGLTHREYVGAAIFDATVAYRRGTGAFGSRGAPKDAYSRGTSRMKVITTDVQLAIPFRLLGKSLRYSSQWRAQWNRTPLVPQDRFSIGGRYTVRGFDGELTLMGERGWVWRNELSLAVGAGQNVYVATDVGHVSGPWTRHQAGQTLAGAAVGLRGRLQGGYWDVFVGKPIHKPEGFKTDSVTAGFNLGWSF